MELPVSLQTAQLGLSALLGAALALFYDLLRALRRRVRALTVPLDLLFSLALLLSLLLFALYAGRGVLRLFMLPGLGLGALLYFLTLSRPVLRALDAVFRLLSLPFRALRRLFWAICKKISEIVKKYVAIVR